ncbi:hypothetical protein E4U46_006716 [Claviceps purpurea]|nr:hypothetical protein E4U46_006716 [Claviceps purpurea]
MRFQRTVRKTACFGEVQSQHGLAGADDKEKFAKMRTRPESSMYVHGEQTGWWGRKQRKSADESDKRRLIEGDDVEDSVTSAQSSGDLKLDIAEAASSSLQI